MNGIVAWFARNAIAANLLMIVAFVGGIFAYFSMEREMFPAIQVAGASVVVSWPGASPDETEENIILRIEEAVADLDGVDRITSIAREGAGVVNIRGRDDIDMDEFIRDIERRVNQINNFPQSAFRPQITQWEERDTYIGFAIYGDTSPRELKRIAEKVRDDIAQIPGGQLAAVNGTLDEQVSIEVSEETLRQYGLTFSQVAQAIRSTSLNASGGQVRTDTGNVSIQARQLADTAEQFERIVISQTEEGAIIRLGDIATVIDGFVDEDLHTSHEGKRAAFIMVSSPDKMQIVQYSDALKEYLERVNDPASGILPEALSMEILWDNSDAFKDRMETIGQSALTGGILVLIVLVLFLRPVVAMWVTIGIFTAFAGGVMLLPLFGVSLNVLSLFAVLLVIGVIVDDAIVVGENIHKEVESGRRQGLDAAIIGTQLVLKPVIFGVLTTIIAFLPWAMLTGPTRVFTEQITFVVVAALTFSLIESMLILPAHLAHMKPQRFDGPGGSILRLQRSIADSLLWFADNIYRPVLELAVKFRYATAAFFFVLFAWSIQLFTLTYVPFSFMPKIEADMIQVSIELPDGTPFNRTEQVHQQVQNGIDLMKAESQERYPEIGGLIQDASIVASGRRVNAWIGLTPPEVRPKTLSSTEIANRFRELVGPIQDAEEIEVSATFNQDDSGIRFSLSHQDLDLLRAAAEDVKGQLASYNTTYDIGDNLSSAADEIRVKLRPGAESLGVTLADVTNQIRQAYFGELVYRLPREDGDVDVRVRLPEETRRDIDSLANLRIRTSDGRQIPVGQVADFEFAPGINVIIRRDLTRSVSVFAELTDDVRNQIVGDMEANYWPGFAERFPSVSRRAIGGFEDEQEFMAEITRLFMIALGAMYILLAIAFRSYSQPALLLTAVPFAFAGAVFGHLMLGVTMALFSFFGIAAAGGVVINDNLVLVDFINRRREEGVGALQAIVDGGVSRFRPILLTSVTTFVGVLPLIAERSVQAQFLKPMVVSLGAAVTFAVFVSLLLVPALYAIGVEVGRVFNWSWNGRPYRQIGETYSGHATIDEEELIGTSAQGNLKPAE